MKECVEDFVDAGMRVWMLTGDKGRTARSIAIQCGLFKVDREILSIEEGSNNEMLLSISHVCKNNSGSC